jgi:chaperonin GroEL (HSP60 family)
LNAIVRPAVREPAPFVTRLRNRTVAKVDSIGLVSGMKEARAAVEEGIVAGGGVARLRASTAIDGLKLEGDEKVGAHIVKRALEEPIRRIVENAGLEVAQAHWRRLDSADLIPLVRAGVRFVDGVRVERQEERKKGAA